MRKHRFTGPHSPARRPGSGRNGERDFRGEKRSNRTHASTRSRMRGWRGSRTGRTQHPGGGQELRHAGLGDPNAKARRTLHVVQYTNGWRSAINGRTTRHPGGAVSQRIRKRSEEVFGSGKEIGGMRRPLPSRTKRVG